MNDARTEGTSDRSIILPLLIMMWRILTGTLPAKNITISERHLIRKTIGARNCGRIKETKYRFLTEK